MKNLSIALNAVLFILVGVLFYFHFTSSKTKTSGSPQLIQADGKTIAVPQIAYVDIDSFQAHYTFFKMKKAELDARQKSMEAELGRSVSAFQSKVATMQQK